jgi:pimeloyl-ACP methyl ester carboxylesterase
LPLQKRLPNATRNGDQCVRIDLEIVYGRIVYPGHSDWSVRKENKMQMSLGTSPEPAGRFVHEEWPYEPKFRRVNGRRMHYIDEGAGDPIILLHGNPAWGFLYRKFVRPLTAAGRRVLVPDMIGFGLSEKPAREQAHSLDGHIANLTSLLRQLDVRNATMVCHDWGGPTGLGFALSNPDRVRALVIMSTWAWPLPPAEFHKRIFPWRLMHAPVVGPYLLGRHNALAGRGMYLSVVDRKKALQGSRFL